MLAVVTAVISANTGPGGSPTALLDGFHAAIVVSVIAAVLGVAAIGLRRRARGAARAEPCPEVA